MIRPYLMKVSMPRYRVSTLTPDLVLGEFCLGPSLLRNRREWFVHKGSR